MDAVYVVRPGNANNELRYSLRSLVENLPSVGRVWLAGHAPRWLHEIDHIAVVQRRGRNYENSSANLLAACEHPEVSERFVFMHDDIFIMKPLKEVPVLHRGLVRVTAEFYRSLGSTRYLAGLEQTLELMERLDIDPATALSYELHAPMVLEKAKMAEALRLPLRLGSHIEGLHKRTLYGNYWAVGGEESHDFKVSRKVHWSPDWPFLSTTDAVFSSNPVGEHIRRVFNSPSPYERR